MSKTKPEAGKIIASVLTQYKALVQGTQDNIRAFIIKNAKQNSRDLVATLTEGKKSGTISAIQPGYGLYFQFAGEVLATKWAKEVEVSKLMAEVAVCQRSAGAEVARVILDKSDSFKKFSDLTRKAEKDKKAKAKPRKSNKPAKGVAVPVEVMNGELVIPESVAGVVTVGMALVFFANRLDSAVDISLSPEEAIIAERVSKKLINLSKIAKSAHPAKVGV